MTVQSFQTIQCSRGKVITDCIIKILCLQGMGDSENLITAINVHANLLRGDYNHA